MKLIADSPEHSALNEAWSVPANTGIGPSVVSSNRQEPPSATVCPATIWRISAWNPAILRPAHGSSSRYRLVNRWQFPLRSIALVSDPSIDTLFMRRACSFHFSAIRRLSPQCRSSPSCEGEAVDEYRTPQERRPRSDVLRNRAVIPDAAQSHLLPSCIGSWLDAIAKEAGVGPGTLYRHFPTREALLAAVLQTWAEEFAARDANIFKVLDPGEALRPWMVTLDEYLSALIGIPEPLMAAARQSEPDNPLTVP